MIDIVFGPLDEPALVLHSLETPDWEVHRIASTRHRTPVPVPGESSFGSVPLTVSFSARTDPDGDALTYDWDFGDGTPHATTVNASHTSSQAGTYTATLRLATARRKCERFAADRRR